MHKDTYAYCIYMQAHKHVQYALMTQLDERLVLQRKKSFETQSVNGFLVKHFFSHHGPKDSSRVLLSKVEIISANEKLLVMTHILYVQMLSEPTECGPHSDVQTICRVLPYIIIGNYRECWSAVHCGSMYSTVQYWVKVLMFVEENLYILLTLHVIIPAFVLVIPLHDVFTVLFFFSFFIITPLTTFSTQEFEIELEGSQTLRLLCYEKCYNKTKQNKEDGDSTDHIMGKGQILV